jgi:hypothetical protein
MIGLIVRLTDFSQLQHNFNYGVSLLSKLSLSLGA